MGSIQLAEAEEQDTHTVFVAVGNNIHKTQQLLHWASHNFPSKSICLLHVHHPHPIDSSPDRNPYRDETRSLSFSDNESKKIHELLDQYVATLVQTGVRAHKLLIEMDNIEKGIMEAIAQHNIRLLVIGAAADRYNLGKLAEQESTKIIPVHKQAVPSCNIWFICNGNIKCTRVDSKRTPEIETAPPLLVCNSNAEAEQSQKFEYESIPNGLEHLDSDDVEEIETVSSHSSLRSKWSSISVADSSKLSGLLFCEEEVDGEIEDKSEINGRLEESTRDSKSMRRKEFEEALKQRKVKESSLEDEALEMESLCAKEKNKRREVEEQLAREKEELQKTKNQQDEIMYELQTVQEQNSALENQLSERQETAKELEEKILSAVDLLISFKEKRDRLQIECANAVRQVRVLREFGKSHTSFSYAVEFPVFSFMEINQATNDFDPSWKIGEGRYGSVYKGVLRNMHVAIKMLPSYGCHSQLEFERQVAVLSRVRHRNLLTLIGTCAESRSLVYEYLNNGSLEGHLARKEKSPLPWQIRISVAADICSALIFLHSSEPSIIHGNLKASKVLLDANFVAKLADIGIHGLVEKNVDSAHTTIHNKPNESLAYVDPEYLATGKFTPESDVYSFGILLLQLLTGRPLLGLVRDVKCALEKDNLEAVLDFSAVIIQEKDSKKNRDLLGAYWDKLSIEEAKEVVSFKNVMLEVKAWLADKEAEALKCQKQLVEEEEAAQKRQAEILERKRQKKLRQKEQKGRELLEDDIEIKRNINSTGEAVLSAETSLDTCVFEAHNSDTFADHASSPHASACHFPDIYEGAERDSGQSVGSLVASHGDDIVENPTKQCTVQEKPVKPDSSQSSNNPLTVKFWRPIDKHGTKDPFPLQNGRAGAEADTYEKQDQTLSGWKEAISSNHVKLVVSPDSEPLECQEIRTVLTTCRSIS
ncbi:hypothetical protein Ahy_B09g100255 [Arachis hypogaea]|uniref:RING-type E3 ubiquitin transferase n=1 Tax=Arachis hypogaea TaxID=3818 RepID=A0A444XX84_ARAHY|nr:hypothetical protein Ahy_B09g100255 [Arachis hypogaea]